MDNNQFFIIAAVAIGLFVIMKIVRAVRRISPKKALELQKGGAYLVDVRAPGEYSSGHIKGAVNIPLDKISRTTSKISKNSDVIVYCLSGARSSSALRQLKSMGYTKVHNLGSIGRWPYSKA